jgi:hypothetical protein
VSAHSTTACNSSNDSVVSYLPVDVADFAQQRFLHVYSQTYNGKGGVILQSKLHCMRVLQIMHHVLQRHAVDERLHLMAVARQSEVVVEALHVRRCSATVSGQLLTPQLKVIYHLVKSNIGQLKK